MSAAVYWSETEINIEDSEGQLISIRWGHHSISFIKCSATLYVVMVKFSEFLVLTSIWDFICCAEISKFLFPGEKRYFNYIHILGIKYVLKENNYILILNDS